MSQGSPIRRTVMVVAVVVAAMTVTGSSAPRGTAAPEPIAVLQPHQRIELPPLGRIAGPEPTRKAELKRSAAPEPSRAPIKKAAPRAKAVESITRISGYTYCGSTVASAQRCIDTGKLTLYYPAGVRTLAGHNYMGWSWMDDLPVGRKVVISSGALAGTYRVYGHGWAKRGSQGGTFPAAGRGASVALQTCTSSGTGFSFLRRA